MYICPFGPSVLTSLATATRAGVGFSDGQRTNRCLRRCHSHGSAAVAASWAGGDRASHGLCDGLAAAPLDGGAPDCFQLHSLPTPSFQRRASDLTASLRPYCKFRTHCKSPTLLQACVPFLARPPLNCTHSSLVCTILAISFRSPSLYSVTSVLPTFACKAGANKVYVVEPHGFLAKMAHAHVQRHTLICFEQENWAKLPMNVGLAERTKQAHLAFTFWHTALILVLALQQSTPSSPSRIPLAYMLLPSASRMDSTSHTLRFPSCLQAAAICFKNGQYERSIAMYTEALPACDRAPELKVVYCLFAHDRFHSTRACHMREALIAPLQAICLHICRFSRIPSLR